MGVNELQKLNCATVLNNKSSDHIRAIDYLESISKKEDVYTTKNITEASLPSRAILLDFEGSPVFLIGIMVHNTLFTFYIKDYEHRTTLYLMILKILSGVKNSIYFAFSDHEKEEIKKIYQYLGCQGIDLMKFIPPENIPIINLQLSTFESLIEALHSVQPDMKITGDVLFRNSKMVNQLFYAKKFNEIILHNRNCLLNESIILKKRWLKLYTV